MTFNPLIISGLFAFEHALANLMEPTHSAQFIALMNRFLAKPRHHRAALNWLQVRPEQWAY